MTSAPFAIAYSIASMAMAVAPPVEKWPNLSAMILAVPPRPATPFALLRAAAAIPATRVPWPPRSDGSLSSLKKSHPFTSST